MVHVQIQNQTTIHPSIQYSPHALSAEAPPLHSGRPSVVIAELLPIQTEILSTFIERATDMREVVTMIRLHLEEPLSIP